jgi:lysozyme family protein
MSEISDLNFNTIINKTLSAEGGYVNDKVDKGGETKFGISKRSYPNVDIFALTLEEAIAIYKRDFWDNQPYKDIHDVAISGKLFDMAVNMGIKNAIIILQRALRACGKTDIVDDGIMGDKTLKAVNLTSEWDLSIALKSEAAGYYRCIVAKNPTQEKFIKGWLNRAYS